MVTLLIFIAVLAVLVITHELGHFIAARKSGIAAPEFGFGFPPRIFGIQVKKNLKLEKISEQESISVQIDRGQNEFGEDVVQETIIDEKKEIDIIKSKRKWRFVWGNRELNEEDEKFGTVYSLNWLPLGGFVKIKGENGESVEADSFMVQKTWKKAIVIVAGVAMNVVLAAVLFSIGYMIGLPTLVDNMGDVSQVKDRKLTIMQVLPGKPAELAGLKSEDIIVKIGDLENPRLSEMQKYVDDHKSEEINISIKRGEEIIEQKIKPIIYEETGKGGIGVGIAELGTVKYPWYQAIWRGFIDTFVYIKEIFIAFYFLIVGLFAGRGAGEAVSGPIGIAVMTGQVAKMGFIYLLQFTAILSLNLAVINILPIPALDGGRLLFLFLNKFKKINFAKYEQTAHAVGFMLLMLLVLVVTVRDVGNFRDVFIGFFKRIF
ncbi:MAG: M50 family metallopeptidase [Candidatus Magasanikbacteria bacterium]|nr:M50 family metallopeptidase [Candidatus Magasanikbacteria bacterium]